MKTMIQPQSLTDEEGKWQTELLKARARLMTPAFFIFQTSHLY